MPNFPVIDRLDVSGYGLFPGPNQDGTGLHIAFFPGMTLILGANGLGKTTLVTIIFRLLTGPYDIPGLIGQVELGNIRLMATEIPRWVRTIFAERVVDGARDARARISLQLGGRKVVIERRLHDLSLTAFSIDGAEVQPLNEDVFHSKIINMVGVWSFGDWILMLRHLVFYFEDRRALVWDASAQRQILRFLFLAPETARKWTEDERAILELDSRVRNLSAVLSREQRALARSEAKVETSVDIHQELKALEKLQSEDELRLERLEDGIPETEGQRQKARLRLMKAEQERESRFRELERSKLAAIGARFPSASDTARYILSQLVTENNCLVCGNVAAPAAKDYVARIETGKCLICGTALSPNGKVVSGQELADKNVELATSGLDASEVDLAESRRELEEAERRYRQLFSNIQELNVALSERSVRIDSLLKRLPPSEANLRKQRSELASLRTSLEEMRTELTAKRQLFRAFVDEIMGGMAAKSDAIKRSFDEYAEGFLLEICRLTWSPQKARLGETGELFDFPAFEVELTGTDFPSPVRRSGPEQVSESQREFIDLAFRMALIAVAGGGGAGTLVMDAPESSLDAVFVSRAANVLLRFAIPSRGNRLVLTSNLVEGRLIPTLAKGARDEGDVTKHIVNLFDIATPTAAVRQLRNQYDTVMTELLREINNPS